VRSNKFYGLVLLHNTLLLLFWF